MQGVLTGCVSDGHYTIQYTIELFDLEYWTRLAMRNINSVQYIGNPLLMQYTFSQPGPSAERRNLSSCVVTIPSSFPRPFDHTKLISHDLPPVVRPPVL